MQILKLIFASLEKKSFIKGKNKYSDYFLCIFNNDIFQGTSVNIYYFFIFKIENTNLFKLVIISYIFFFSKEIAILSSNVLLTLSI